MEKINLEIIKRDVQKELAEAKTLKELDLIFKKYLGKKGIISEIFHSLKNLKNEKKRQEIGKEANRLKRFIEEKIKEKTPSVVEISTPKGKKEYFDITVPGKKPSIGHLHPLTITRRKIEEIFQGMGFSVADGPELENEWYNFDALNIPKDHPARDVWDTLWIKQKRSKDTRKNFLLRTHTSPVQVRYMEKHNPPFRIIIPGRVFRHEATDASHEIQFYQVEGLMVDKNVSAGNFKAIVQEFFSKFFQKQIKTRLRPSFFPFTEPSFEVDIECLNCGGKGCSSCSYSGWMEIMGAGMVHPNVLKAGGLNPKNWQGFAFGIGLDRLAMLKYKINDIRLFYQNDLRFLSQF